MKQSLVKVIVPIYKTELPDIEIKAFINNMKILARYSRVLLCPEELDVTEFLRLFPNIEIVRVSSDWLG